jgi:hypothetical protein
MAWSITWPELSRKEKAGFLAKEVEREKKSKGKWDCCICPEAIVKNDRYRQHAGKAERRAHSQCVSRHHDPNKQFVPINTKRYGVPMYPNKPKLKYTEDEFSRAVEKARAAGFAEGFKMGTQNDIRELVAETVTTVINEDRRSKSAAPTPVKMKKRAK